MFAIFYKSQGIFDYVKICSHWAVGKGKTWKKSYTCLYLFKSLGIQVSFFFTLFWYTLSCLATIPLTELGQGVLRINNTTDWATDEVKDQV